MDSITLWFDEDGVAREYKDDYDITIHCETEEEQAKAEAMLRRLHWTPVKDALPEDGQPCLVYTRQRERFALVYQWEDCDECEINSFDTFDVTHWMPLPEPPEEA